MIDTDGRFIDEGSYLHQLCGAAQERSTRERIEVYLIRARDGLQALTWKEVEERYYPDEASQPLLVERILKPQPSFEHMGLAEYQQHVFNLQREAEEADTERREQGEVEAEIMEEIAMREAIGFRDPRYPDHEDLYAHLYPFALTGKPNGHPDECVCGSQYCDPEPPEWFKSEAVEWAKQTDQSDNASAHLLLLNLATSDMRLEERSTRHGVEERLLEYAAAFVQEYDWFAGQGVTLIQEGEDWGFYQPQPEPVEVQPEQMTDGEEHPF